MSEPPCVVSYVFQGTHRPFRPAARQFTTIPLYTPPGSSTAEATYTPTRYPRLTLLL